MGLGARIFFLWLLFLWQTIATTTTTGTRNKNSNDETYISEKLDNNNSRLAGSSSSSSSSSSSDLSSINFMAIGDWGKIGAFPFYPFPSQSSVAQGMRNVASEKRRTMGQPMDFIVSLGDNFYRWGVSEKTMEQRFQTTFESIYNDSALIDIPWYVIAGNHDHYGDVYAQIQYTNHPSNTNQRWQFPSLYHAHSFVSSSSSSLLNSSGVSSSSAVPPVTVDLILIDTNDLCSQSDGGISLMSYLRPKQTYAMNNDTEQWHWLRDKLRSSTADYLLVAGHFPIYSIGDHGATPALVTYLKPLLEQYQAHYLSGHDHSMMHWKEPRSTVNYILTGTGNDCCGNSVPDKENNQKWNPSNITESLKWSFTHETKRQYQKMKPKHNVKGGFASFQATKQSMIVQYHDQEGNVLYEADPILPRVHHSLSLSSSSSSSSSSSTIINPISNPQQIV